MSERILSVDDRADNRYLLETILRGYGYEVESASNGLTALKKLETERYDAIISDILMPQMDGFALCRELKKRGNLQNIPLIFYSANYTSKPDKTLAIKLGASGFISKPARPDAIAKALRDALNQRQAPNSNDSDATTQSLDNEVFLKDHNERLFLKLEEKLEELDSLSSCLSRSLEKENLRSGDLERMKTLLREREETQSTILEQTGRLIYEVDLANRRVRWRGVDGKLKVDAASSTDPDWEVWRKFIHPEDFKRVRSQRDLVHHECDTEGISKTFTIRYRARAKDFPECYVEVEDQGCYLPSVHGIASRLVGCIFEVAETQEQELQRRQMTFLLEKAREALMILSISGKVTFLNQRARELFGPIADLGAGCNLNDFFPDSFHQLSKPWETALREGTWKGELSLISPDGSEIILDSEWHLMRDKKGGPESVMAVCEDITELRRLEELEANRE